MNSVPDARLGRLCFETYAREAHVGAVPFESLDVVRKRAWIAAAKAVLSLVEKKHCKKYRVVIEMEDLSEGESTAPSLTSRSESRVRPRS